MTQINLPTHHIYGCEQCGDSWLEENEASKARYRINRCMSCGSTRVTKSSNIPLPLAHGLLRKGMNYTTKNVIELIGNSSIERWNKSVEGTKSMFEEQIALLTNIYDAMIMNSKDV